MFSNGVGGLVLKEQKYIDFGLALVNGCEDTYAQDLTGIGPEAFSWVTNTTALDDTVNPQPPLSQLAFYDKAGFYVTNSQYILRPEVLESFYCRSLPTSTLRSCESLILSVGRRIQSYG